TGQISLGSIQAFIQYVRQFNQPLTQVASMYNTLQSGIASAERVFDLLDTDEQTPDPTGSAPERRGPGRVEFEHVGFEYRPRTSTGSSRRCPTDTRPGSPTTAETSVPARSS